jgi:hypothetical protein
MSFNIDVNIRVASLPQQWLKGADGRVSIDDEGIRATAA